MKNTALAVWGPELALGFPNLDAQHARFLDLLGELHSAIARGLPEAQLRAINARLSDHAALHFAAEEALLASLDYPELGRHRAEHEELSDRLARLILTGGWAGAAVSLATRALVDHVLGSDREFARWFEARTTRRLAPTVKLHCAEAT